MSFVPQRQSQLVGIAAALELGRVDVLSGARDIRFATERSERTGYDVALVDVRDFEIDSSVRCAEQLADAHSITKLIVLGSRRPAPEETARRLFATGASGYIEVADGVTEAELTQRIRTLVFTELATVNAALSPEPPQELGSEQPDVRTPRGVGAAGFVVT